MEESLKRLRVERIDLYQSHTPDPATPHAETLGAYQELMQAGKIRAIGASNYSAEQLGTALAAAAAQACRATRRCNRSTISTTAQL